MKLRTVALYEPNEIARQRTRLRLWIGAAAAIAAATLLACIVLCTRVRTENAQRLLLWCVALSTLGGWIVLSLRIFAIDECRNAIRHAEAMLSGPREIVEGTFALTTERVRIKNGVSMVRVSVCGAPQVQSLQLYDKKRKRFESANPVRVTTVYGFIVAYEEAADA